MSNLNIFKELDNVLLEEIESNKKKTKQSKVLKESTESNNESKTLKFVTNQEPEESVKIDTDGKETLTEELSNDEVIATNLVTLMYDFDTYDFNDKYETMDEAFDEVLKDLSNPQGRKDIEDYLNEMLEDSSDEKLKDNIKFILDRLNNTDNTDETLDDNKEETSNINEDETILVTATNDEPDYVITDVTELEDVTPR